MVDARPGALDSSWFRAGGAMAGEHGRRDVDCAYVCMADEAGALAAALALHARPDSESVPVAIAVADEHSGVARALSLEQRELRALRPVGIYTRTCSASLLDEGLTETIARAKHEAYVRDERTRGLTQAQNPSICPWDELPESLKQSNRRFADGVGAKLAAADCIVVPAPLADPEDPGFAFDEPTVEALARQEHDRWVADLRRDGWRHTNGPKDPRRRLHPLLVGWERLSEDERERDREPVRAIPSLLARAGFVIRPLARPPRGVALPELVTPR